MKLSAVQVREFKSIRESNEFEVGDVTCLVGKNEAGKTALLEALYRLNPIVEADGKFDITNDYPRADVEDYRLDVEQKRRQPATVVIASFSLDTEERAAIEDEFGEGVLIVGIIKVSRGYSNNLSFDLRLDEAATVKHLVNKAGLPEDIQTDAAKQPTLKQLQSFLTTKSVAQQQALAAAQQQAEQIEDPQEKAKALDEAKQLGESEAAKQLRTQLTKEKSPLRDQIWTRHLKDRLPKFLYFDEYYQMEGQVNIDSLNQRQASSQLLDSDRPMLALIDLARLNLDQLLKPQNTQELINRLEGASNHLSRKIFDYWSQNKHLSVRFDIRQGLPGDPPGMTQGTNLWGFVYDSAHEVTIRLGTRSRGFIWFFSFLAWFSQQRKSGLPLILLLDEPGLFLHASAQSDLLRYIEDELRPYHQVIFTTHSPFMIDPPHFERVRIVRDRTMEDFSGGKPLPRDQQGTKVLSDVLEADEGSLFPLQGALAYDITQTLFIGPNSLVVEGVSDLFYLNAVTDILDRAGRQGLSPAWTIVPVGGGDKVPTFVALFRAQKGLNVATLIDFQKKDEQKIENLYKQKLMQQKQVLTFSEFTKTTEADIEDMFAPAFYLQLVNEDFKNDLMQPITEGDLTEKHPRILVRLEKYFEQHPMKGKTRFNHYRPARHFAENVGALSPKLDSDTLIRFEEAFKRLNGLL